MQQMPDRRGPKQTAQSRKECFLNQVLLSYLYPSTVALPQSTTPSTDNQNKNEVHPANLPPLPSWHQHGLVGRCLCPHQHEPSVGHGKQLLHTSIVVLPASGSSERLCVRGSNHFHHQCCRSSYLGSNDLPFGSFGRIQQQQPQ